MGILLMPGDRGKGWSEGGWMGGTPETICGGGIL